MANAVIQLASFDSQMDETRGVIEAARRTLRDLDDETTTVAVKLKGKNVNTVGAVAAQMWK